MLNKIDIKKCQDDARYVFTHGFACSESVIYALNKHFEMNLSEDAIAMSSGFPWGLGGAGCICGAVAGATMILGSIFGRRKIGDDCIQRCFELTKEMHDRFTAEFEAVCCGRLIEGMERNSDKRKLKCIKQVECVIQITAQIIMREMREK